MILQREGIFRIEFQLHVQQPDLSAFSTQLLPIGMQKYSISCILRFWNTSFKMFFGDSGSLHHLFRKQKEIIISGRYSSRKFSELRQRDEMVEFFSFKIRLFFAGISFLFESMKDWTPFFFRIGKGNPIRLNRFDGT